MKNKTGIFNTIWAPFLIIILLDPAFQYLENLNNNQINNTLPQTLVLFLMGFGATMATLGIIDFIKSKQN